jgi:prepilin peptidase CpaA
MSTHAFIVIALGVGAVSAATDALRGRIPNIITLPAIGLGLAFHAALGRASLLLSIVGLVVAASLPWFLRRMTRGQAIGGGDVKLFAALGALLGPVAGLEVELSSFILLGVFAMLRLTFEGQLGPVVVNAGFLLVNPLLPQRFRRALEPQALTEMRLGPAVFMGVVTVTFADQVARVVPWLR